MTNGPTTPAGEGEPLAAPLISRRRVLLGLGAGVLGVAGGRLITARPGTSQGSQPLAWDDPAAWASGRVPRPGDAGVLVGDTVLRSDAEVAALHVPAGASLSFDPHRDVTLTSHGNVVVEGALRMTPERADVAHTLRFAGVDEERARGGGRDVLPDDVGLWVMGAGALQARGTPRRSWSRLAVAATAGTAVLELVDDPDGWRPGDELVVVPTAAPSDGRQHQGYDPVTVARVAGRRVELTAPLGHDHPLVPVAGTAGLGAEVLNLTRNVVVGGTTGGRAHVLLSTTTAPRLAHLRVEHAGPQRLQGVTGEQGAEIPTPVLGRYGLHFHHCGEAVRDTLVEGAVVTGCGNHAFVAHESHGVRFRDCVAHDTTLSAFWWDAAGGTDATHDTTYERCVASLTRGVDVALTASSAALTRRIAGFELVRGRGNAAVGCVSVGVQGGQDSAGFVWPEEAEGVWTVRDCVSHNHRHHGAFVWQNTSQPHEVERLTSYHNAEHGIVHGAYSNNYRYLGCVSYGNAGSAVLRQANTAGPDARQEWHDCRFDAAGQGDYALDNGPHAYPPARDAGDVLFSSCAFTGAKVAAVGLFDSGDLRSWCALDFVDCRFDEPRFDVGNAHEGTRWRVQSGDGATEHRWSTGASEAPVAPFERSY